MSFTRIYPDPSIFTDSITPAANDAYSIGNSSNNWHDGYFTGTIVTPKVDNATGILDIGHTGQTINLNALTVTHNDLRMTSGFVFGMTGAPAAMYIGDNATVIKFRTDITPDGNAAYSLGSSSVEWYDGYFAGTVTTPKIDNASSVDIASSASSLSMGSPSGGFTLVRNAFLVGNYSFSGASFQINGASGGGVTEALLKAADASSGTQLVDSPNMILRGTYWNGSASVNSDVTITHKMDTTGPTSHLSFAIDGYDLLRLNSDGNVLPTLNDAYSLGSSSNKWHDGYFAGTLEADGGANIGAGPGLTVNNIGTVTSTLNANGGVQTNAIQRWSGGDANFYTTTGTYTVHIGGTGNTVSIESNSLVFANTTSPNTITIDGYTVNPTNNAITLGDSSHNWKDGYVTNTHSSWFDTKIGTQLTVSSNAVTPTSGLHHVDATGGVTINSINTTNVPASSTVELILIADAGAITLGTTNIKVGGTIAQDTAQKLVWDGSFWYLVA